MDFQDGHIPGVGNAFDDGVRFPGLAGDPAAPGIRVIGVFDGDIDACLAHWLHGPGMQDPGTGIGQFSGLFIGQFGDQPALGDVVRVRRHESRGVFPDFQEIRRHAGRDHGRRIIGPAPAKGGDLSGVTDAVKSGNKQDPVFRNLASETQGQVFPGGGHEGRGIHELAVRDNAGLFRQDHPAVNAPAGHGRRQDHGGHPFSGHGDHVPHPGCGFPGEADAEIVPFQFTEQFIQLLKRPVFCFRRFHQAVDKGPVAGFQIPDNPFNEVFRCQCGLNAGNKDIGNPVKCGHHKYIPLSPGRCQVQNDVCAGTVLETPTADFDDFHDKKHHMQVWARCQTIISSLT